MIPNGKRGGSQQSVVIYQLLLVLSKFLPIVLTSMSFMFLMAHKQEALKLYKNILRLSRTWNAKSIEDTAKERVYIKTEAKETFNRNKSLIIDEEIKKRIDEGWKRVEIAKHYGIPYPRPVYFEVGTVTNIEKKRMKKKRDLSTK